MSDDLWSHGSPPEVSPVRAGRPAGSRAGRVAAGDSTLAVVREVAPAPRGSAAGAPRFVGRETEVAEVLAALGELASGRGRAIALVGEPGIGKSALMLTATAHARAAGVRVLAAHGRRALAPVLAPEPTPALAPAPTGVRPPADGSRELRELHEQMARGTATLVAVDDLHQLAPERITEVERLLHTAATGPALCLLAYRQRQLAPALAAVLARAASMGQLDVRHLGPLSREQVLELLGEHPDAREVHRACQGNPQYLKVLAAKGEAGADAALAILGELAELDHTALAVVQAAAVLGEPCHPDLLAAVAGLEAAATMRALDDLSRLDLIRPVDPAPQLTLRHRAVAEVVYQRLEPSRRLALHRGAELALAERAAPIARRAHHVVRAADPGRPEHVTTLIAAARDSLHSSPAAAAEYLQAALSLLHEGEPHWHEARVLLAQTRLLTGDAPESRALLDALRSAGPGRPPHQSGAPTALADASRVERRLGRFTEAGAIARDGLTALADQDSATAAALHAELADYSYDLQDFATSRRHAETGAAIARRHHDRVGEANALAQASLAHLFTADLAAALTTVTRSAELIDATSDAVLLTNLEAAYQLGMTEGMLGRLTDSERHLDRGATLSRRTGQTYVRPMMLMSLANTQLRSGNLRHALATLDEAGPLVERAGNPATRAGLATFRSEALLWRGGVDDLREAVELADRAAAIADGQTPGWAVGVRCLVAGLVLLTGDPTRAGWLLLDAAGGTELPRLTAWRRPRFCDTLAELALAQGDRASVEHWALLAERGVEELPSASRLGFALRARMRAHAMRGETERALLGAQEAGAHFAAGGERIEVGRTLVMAAALALDAGGTEQVADRLDRAALLADQCGSARLADEVAHQRGRLAARAGRAATRNPGPVDALAGLTAREREIAGLASTGLTSGEIAGALVLSVRTIDSHLGRIYRKLGVPNRASLTHAVLGATPDPP
ncbi:LuxR C-terminal-related transcriptional regulator [Kitasatospora sp. NBC_01287]|uniref:AAA family ATPase n=1 Tax=Kitasatospora sp. NBC_01287 TaxID=2903573 RepID=UPI00224F1D23|nr:AAA family ATPase [Kitasatospora sp. NBC_01287]MCX4751509.1 LuxR C-terminal-related transcriptional regulator [Kitasatospora sp. NBC_01287]